MTSMSRGATFMASAPQAPPVLLTAEEFARRPDPGYPEELVKGRIVAMPPPGFRHCEVCAQAVFLLKSFLRESDLGRVLSNDGGVITERGPDSVRGPDISFYRYERLPRGDSPAGYPEVSPDLVFEVLSPTDRWPKVLGKVLEYLDAGVAAVCVIDPERRSLHLYEGDQPVRILGEADELALPALLGDFRVAVGRFLD
jgi:Uma2 family endonuclease